MMDKVLFLNEAAKIFYTGTHENRLLRHKNLKKRAENCSRNTGIFFILPQVYRFSSDFTKSRSFGLLLLLLLLRTKNDPFRPGNYRFFTGREVVFAPHA